MATTLKTLNLFMFFKNLMHETVCLLNGNNKSLFFQNRPINGLKLYGATWIGKWWNIRKNL